MCAQFYIYKKTTEDIQIIADLIHQNDFQISNCKVFIDSSRDFINYKELQNQLLAEKGLLFINSLHSIGNTKESILEELQWLKTNQIELVIAEMPSTWIFNKSDLNLQSINVLIDMFEILKGYNNFEFQNPEFTEGGRKKIQFPENWEKLFELYSSKQISANEFQQQVGLKRATFFNLLSEYKQLLKINSLDYLSSEYSTLQTSE